MPIYRHNRFRSYALCRYVGTRILSQRLVSSQANSPLVRLGLDNRSARFYNPSMKITAKLKGEIMRQMGSLGGKSRAKKYDKATLSKWAKMGGRPRKNREEKP